MLVSMNICLLGYENLSDVVSKHWNNLQINLIVQVNGIWIKFKFKEICGR